MNFMIKFVLLNLIIYHFKLLNLLRIEIDSSITAIWFMFYILMKFIFSKSDVFILFQIYSEVFSDMTYQMCC